MKSYFVILLSLFLCFNLSAKEKYVVKTDVLNVRKEPSATSSSIAKIYKGDIIEVSYNTNGWSMLYIDMQRGWVSTKYIKKVPKQRIQKKKSQGFATSGNGNVLPMPIVFDRYVLDFTDYSFGIDQKILTYIILFLGIFHLIFSFREPAGDTKPGDRYRIIYDLSMFINSFLLIYYFLAMPNPFWFFSELPWYKVILSFVLFVLYAIGNLFFTYFYFEEYFEEREKFSLSPLFWIIGSLAGLITAFYTSEIWLLSGLAIIVGTSVFYGVKIFKHHSILSGIWRLVIYLSCNFAVTIIALLIIAPVLIFVLFKISGIVRGMSAALASGDSGSSDSSSSESNEQADESTSINVGGSQVNLEEGWNGTLHGDDGKDYEYSSPFKDKVREVD